MTAAAQTGSPVGCFQAILFAPARAVNAVLASFPAAMQMTPSRPGEPFAASALTSSAGMKVSSTGLPVRWVYSLAMSRSGCSMRLSARTRQALTGEGS